jgi:hypothetical protein
MHAKDSCKVAGRRQPLPGARLSFRDIAANFGGHLLVEPNRLLPVNSG